MGAQRFSHRDQQVVGAARRGTNVVEPGGDGCPIAVRLEHREPGDLVGWEAVADGEGPAESFDFVVG